MRPQEFGNATGLLIFAWVSVGGLAFFEDVIVGSVCCRVETPPAETPPAEADGADGATSAPGKKVLFGRY